MIFSRSPLLPDVIIVQPDVHADKRGYFMETYHREAFAAGGIDRAFVQENQSNSTKGTLRGLHYQIQRPQGKLVRVLYGEIYDVSVDIRRSSPNFGKWFGIRLSAENKKALYVPPNFAHGFCVLSERAEFFYKCTDFYAPECEHGIRWNDPDIGIEWPGDNFKVSEKDEQAALLNDMDNLLPIYKGV